MIVEIKKIYKAFLLVPDGFGYKDIETFHGYYEDFDKAQRALIEISQDKRGQTWVVGEGWAIEWDGVFYELANRAPIRVLDSAKVQLEQMKIDAAIKAVELHLGCQASDGLRQEITKQITAEKFL